MTAPEEYDLLLQCLALYEAAEAGDEDAISALGTVKGSLTDPAVMQAAMLEYRDRVRGLLSVLKALKQARMLPPDWSVRLRTLLLALMADDPDE